MKIMFSELFLSNLLFVFKYLLHTLRVQGSPACVQAPDLCSQGCRGERGARGAFGGSRNSGWGQQQLRVSSAGAGQAAPWPAQAPIPPANGAMLPNLLSWVNAGSA